VAIGSFIGKRQRQSGLIPQPGEMTMADQPADFGKRCPRDAAQMRRVLDLLDVATNTQDPNSKFAVQVGALHLTRSIPEHWYTTADQIPISLNKQGKDADELSKRMRAEFEAIFLKARRYELLSALRHWDYHWEPLLHPQAIPESSTYGRGAPVKLSTGPIPNSSVTFLAGNRLSTTGSGRRVGRTNYYQIHRCRFVDSSRSEALPLELAIREFVEDLPECILEILAKSEIAEYQKRTYREKSG
jgi:hypothetical protein